MFKTRSTTFTRYFVRSESSSYGDALLESRFVSPEVQESQAVVLLALTPGQEIVIFPARILRYARNAGASGTGGLGMQEYEGSVGANPAHRSLVLLHTESTGPAS